VNSFIRVLERLGFIQKQKTGAKYALTEIAEQWPESPGMLDVVCCLHKKISVCV